MSWLYNNQPINSLQELPRHEELVGFCYRITNLQTGAIYIGKKSVTSKRKKALPKKQLSTDKRKKTYTVVVKESDWKTYWGSCKPLLEDIARLGEQQFTRQILELCYTKKQLTFSELKYQFTGGQPLHSVLEQPSYNGNILGRFYPRDLQPS